MITVLAALMLSQPAVSAPPLPWLPATPHHVTSCVYLPAGEAWLCPPGITAPETP